MTSVRILVVGRRLAEGVSDHGSMVAEPVMGCGWSACAGREPSPP